MSRHSDALHRVLPLIEKYLEQNRDTTVPVVHHLDPRSLRSELDLALSEEGAPIEQLLPLMESYLHYSVRTGHRDFGNQLFGGFNMAGFLGDVLTSLTNTSMYTYEVAPVATLMELELIHKMSSLIGFTGGEGIFCSGGSNANMIGLLCAREHAFPQVKTRGFRGAEKPVMFISDQAHYSFLKSAIQLGIGTENVRILETGPDGRMPPERLDRECRKSRDRGENPFFVGATAGTTVLGAFDPIAQLAGVCRKHDLWLHVDGSWGAPVILSRKHAHLLDGSEQADSFSWDAHKLMGATLICAAFLTRHEGALRRACSTSSENADYLFHESEDAAYDLGRMSLQCGRRVDALKLWLMWKHYGDRGLAARVGRLFELAESATERVIRHPNLELMAPTQALNVCFRYLPDHACDPNALNLVLRERLRKAGRNFVNYSYLGPDLVLRLVLANPEVGESDLTRFFDSVTQVGAQLAREPASGVMS